MKKGLLLLILALLVGPGSAVRAELRAGAFYLTPQIGGYVFEGNQNLDHSLTYGLGLGYVLDKHWAGELTFNFIDAEFETFGGDVDGYLLRLDGLYHFTPERRLVPYLAAGIGGIRLDPDLSSSDNSFLINAGGGLKYFLTDGIALRGDARYVLTFDETHNNLIYTVIVSMLFLGKSCRTTQMFTHFFSNSHCFSTMFIITGIMVINTVINLTIRECIIIFVSNAIFDLWPSAPTIMSNSLSSSSEPILLE